MRRRKARKLKAKITVKRRLAASKRKLKLAAIKQKHLKNQLERKLKFKIAEAKKTARKDALAEIGKLHVKKSLAHKKLERQFDKKIASLRGHRRKLRRKIRAKRRSFRHRARAKRRSIRRAVGGRRR